MFRVDADRALKPARVIRLHPFDNVAVAVSALTPGTVVGDGVVASERIPRGHKVATLAVAQGGGIRKYGETIGVATAAIEAGDWVHEHNCTVAPLEHDYRFSENGTADALLPVEQRAGFMGFRRADGRVGTRNYLAIVSTVNCSSSVARFIADEVTRSGMLDEFENVDGVIPVVHGAGCGVAGRSEGFELLIRTALGYASHPNVGAVLAIGLGCEVFQVAELRRRFGTAQESRLQTLTIQGVGGTRRAVEEGVKRVRELLASLQPAERESVSASELVLAVQCGGSDGYSGITANPALGHAADILVRNGGTVILSETPEVYGAEHLLTRRAVTRAVGEKLVERIRWWEEYTERNGAVMNNNPSPGNKAGGLTTILEKSLGAVAKGGTTPLNAVYLYAEPIAAKGLVFMDTPGFDPVSVTGQVAGGANIICFTTGRGSAFGCKPAPSVKIATNTDVYERMSDDMDVNCGDVLDEGVSIEAKGEEIFAEILRVASGARTRSEELGYGDLEFVPWQIGAVM